MQQPDDAEEIVEGLHSRVDARRNLGQQGFRRLPCPVYLSQVRLFVSFGVLGGMRCVQSRCLFAENVNSLCTLCKRCAEGKGRDGFGIVFCILQKNGVFWNANVHVGDSYTILSSTVLPYYSLEFYNISYRMPQGKWDIGANGMTFVVEKCLRSVMHADIISPWIRSDPTTSTVRQARMRRMQLGAGFQFHV